MPSRPNDTPVALRSARRALTGLAVLAALAAPSSAADALPPAGYRFELPVPCREDAERASKRARPNDAVYEVCADQMSVFARAMAEAKARDKLLLVTFGATWCPWCSTLQKAMPGGELLGHKSAALDLGKAFHHVEIGLSMLHAGKKADIPSGEAVLAHVLKSAPGVKVRAIPFLAVIDPKDPARVFARNMDDVAMKDGSHDLPRVRQLFTEAHAFVTGKGSPPDEPGWLKRKWLRWWYG